MLEMLANLWQLLTRRERWQVLGLLVLMLAGGLLDALGVASILPFLGLLAQPELVRQNQWMNLVFTRLGFNSVQSFLFFLGIVVLVLMVLTNTLAALTTLFSERFVWNKNQDLSQALLRGYLERPYAELIRRNSAELNKNVNLEVFYTSRMVLSPFLDLIGSLISVLFIIAFLVVIDPRLTLIAAAVLGGAYGIVYLRLRRQLTRLGKRRKAADALRFKTVNEALGGIKEVKVLQREAEFVRRFEVPLRAFSNQMAAIGILSVLPHFLLETLAFGSLLIVILYQMSFGSDVRTILPIVGLYAFAGYRLMPALKAIFKDATQIRFQKSSLDIVHNELLENTKWLAQNNIAPQPLPFHHTIELHDLSFRYAETNEPVLRDASLLIQQGQSIALVGATGAGKSTLVDILLGLFQPQSGYVAVDGIKIDEQNLPRWRALIGYVPQQIFLCDDTLTRNIAFGIPDDEIDQAAVERAAQIANLHGFINELPKGYETIVGERGVRLSGGQRQRVGIARALYHSPDVLILDEATSSLDGITEDAVLKAIDNIAQSKTLITIAHRLTTVQDCDVVYLLDKGCLIAQGTYGELLESNAQFRAMARLVSPNGGSEHASQEYALPDNELSTLFSEE